MLKLSQSFTFYSVTFQFIPQSSFLKKNRGGVTHWTHSRPWLVKMCGRQIEDHASFVWRSLFYGVLYVFIPFCILAMESHFLFTSQVWWNRVDLCFFSFWLFATYILSNQDAPELYCHCSQINPSKWSSYYEIFESDPLFDKSHRIISMPNEIISLLLIH